MTSFTVYLQIEGRVSHGGGLGTVGTSCTHREGGLPELREVSPVVGHICNLLLAGILLEVGLYRTSPTSEPAQDNSYRHTTVRRVN